MNSIKISNNRIKSYEIIFVLLSVLNITISITLKIEYVCYLLFVYILCLRMVRVIDNQTFLFLSLFVPNKYLQLFAIPIYLFFDNSLLTKKINKKVVIFVAFIFFVSVINCFYYGGAILGTIFQTVVYYCILRFIPAFDRKIEIQSIVHIIDWMIILQSLTAVIEYLYYKMITDTITGTMISAHYLGVFLLVYLYIVIKTPYYKNTKFKLLRILASLMLLCISDAKHVWIVFVVAYFFSVLLKKLKIKRSITFAGVFLALSVVVFVYLGNHGMLDFLTGRFSAATIYLYNTNYNKKMLFFTNTFEQMKGINGLIGFGVGQYGSQVSLTMAKGIIYSWDTALQNYTYAIQPYANAIRGIMTEWYVKTGIASSSMVLGYPLVSFIGLFAELGIIGYFILLRFFDDFFRDDNPVFIIFFLFLTLFDTYFEIPCVFVMLLIATQVAKVKRKDLVYDT